MRIKPLGKCAMGREAMRQPALVLAGPRGSLYALGFISGDGRGIAPIRLSASGAPSALAGPSGCLLGDSIFTKEKTPCSHPFAADTLPGSEDTLSFTPDGRAAYVLKQVQAADTIQLNVLARRP